MDTKFILMNRLSAYDTISRFVRHVSHLILRRKDLQVISFRKCQIPVFWTEIIIRPTRLQGIIRYNLLLCIIIMEQMLISHKRQQRLSCIRDREVRQRTNLFLSDCFECVIQSGLRQQHRFFPFRRFACPNRISFCIQISITIPLQLCQTLRNELGIVLPSRDQILQSQILLLRHQCHRKKKKSDKPILNLHKNVLSFYHRTTISYPTVSGRCYPDSASSPDVFRCTDCHNPHLHPDEPQQNDVPDDLLSYV